MIPDDLTEHAQDVAEAWDSFHNEIIEFLEAEAAPDDDAMSRNIENPHRRSGVSNENDLISKIQKLERDLENRDKQMHSMVSLSKYKQAWAMGFNAYAVPWIKHSELTATSTCRR